MKPFSTNGMFIPVELQFEGNLNLSWVITLMIHDESRHGHRLYRVPYGYIIMSSNELRASVLIHRIWALSSVAGQSKPGHAAAFSWAEEKGVDE